jgi:hypothetical protein
VRGGVSTQTARGKESLAAVHNGVGFLSALAVMHDGSAVVSASNDGVLAFCGPSDGMEHTRLDGSGLNASSMAISTDDRWVLVAGNPLPLSTSHADVRDLWRHRTWASLEQKVSPIAAPADDEVPATAPATSATRPSTQSASAVDDDTLGRWYDMHGLYDWAVGAFLREVPNGADGADAGALAVRIPSGVTFARSLWLSGRHAQAAAAFEALAAAAHDTAEADYLRLCAAAAKAGETH